MIIRQGTEADVEALARLRWALRMDDTPPDDRYPEFEATFRRFYADALSSGRWVVWLIEQDSEVVSHIYVQLIEKVPRPGALDQCFGYVTNVYTRPAYRNQGLGSRLMAQVVTWAKAQQLEFLILWPSERSVPYYQRIGFEYPQDALELYLSDDS